MVVLASYLVYVTRLYTCRILIEILDFISGDCRRGSSDVYQGAWHGFDRFPANNPSRIELQRWTRTSLLRRSLKHVCAINADGGLLDRWLKCSRPLL